MVTVSTDNTVTVTNNLDNGTKTLDVTFPGFYQLGSNTDTISTSNTISVSNINNALFGTWTGIITYTVNIDNAAAGLYDTNGVMLCDWDESGIDTSIDYGYKSTESNYASNITTSGNYVLTNNYPSTAIIFFPDTITTIGNGCFVDCDNIEEVNFSETLERIGICAFAKCNNLGNVYIGDIVTSVEPGAFAGCPNMNAIYVSNNNDAYTSENGILFSKDKTSLYQFPAGSTITSYVIPDTVSAIWKWAFYTSAIESINIPNNVTAIGDYAFQGCLNLESIKLPNNIATIPVGMLYGSGVKEVYIPLSVTTIRHSAFYFAGNLNNIFFEGTELQWDAITKGNNWDYQAGSYTDLCTYTINYNYSE